MYDAEKVGGGGQWLNRKPLQKSYERLLSEVNQNHGANLTGDQVLADFEREFFSLSKSQAGSMYHMMQELADLKKSLATTETGFPSGTQQPILLENLDSQMTEILVTTNHLKLFQSIPRVTSIQTYYQWMRHVEYGSRRRAPGFVEGGSPKAGSSKWQRGNMMNKFMGVRRGVTHPMMVTGQLGGSFVDPVMSENRDGTLQLLEMIERWLIWGNKDIKDLAGNEVNYDGIYQQLVDNGGKSIIDLRGKPLDFEDLENYAYLFTTRGKLLDFSNIRSFWHPQVLSDLAAFKALSERKMLGTMNPPEGYRPGVPLRGYDSQHGYIPFEASILLDPVPDGAPLTAAEAGVGTTKPTVSAQPSTTSDSTSLMTPGTYYYGIAAFDETGETDPTITSAVVVTTTNQDKVTFAFNISSNCVGYRIYRGTKSDLSDAGWIQDVVQTGGPTITVTDKNEVIPGSGIGIIMNLNEADIALAQMLPLTKWPVAVTETKQEFFLILYHVLAVKAAERVIFVKNIGRRVF